MKAAVIGSGIGGLAIAIRLAIKGYKVTVFEKNDRPGGKLAEIKAKGYRFDTGPSLFTLPELVDELETHAGEANGEKLSYTKLDIICKYFFPNGKILNAYTDPERFALEAEKTVGEEANRIRRHLRRVAALYKQTAHIFLFSSLHKIKSFFTWEVLKAVLRFDRVNLFSTMHRVNRKRFKTLEIVQLFDRYATYNGSSPYMAPATLNVIGHLENNIGAYFPDQGMYSIVEHLSQLAKSKGVEFQHNTLISQIKIQNKKATGIVTNDEEMHFDVICSDTDVSYLADNMMEHPLKKRLQKMEPSSSALIFYWGLNKEFPELELHNILFSDDYEKEFNAYFREKTIYRDPSIYIFISKKHVKEDAPDGCENWYVMVNAPTISGQNWDTLIKTTRKNLVNKINSVLNTNIEEHFEFEEIGSPLTIEANTLSKGGALYGPSGNSKFSAILRHPNFLRKIKNLYFVGGSVHPGGGIPLCLASAKIVDLEIPKAK
jgi:phytoene desaturase